ncbi:MAG: hypothetical protein ABR951_00050 [Candidatus Aminicenantales bacterium]|jgi:hypothetical protein
MNIINEPPENKRPGKKGLSLLPALAVLLSVAGLAGFLYLFVRDFNIYWLMLSPVIIAFYQVPAAFVFWLHKKRRAAAARSGRMEGQGPEPDPPGGGMPGKEV